MLFDLLDGVLLVLLVYLAAGIGFAVAFATWGASVIDPAAKHMPMTARWLILPGATALWPLLLVKWLRRQSPPLA